MTAIITRAGSNDGAFRQENAVGAGTPEPDLAHLDRLELRLEVEQAELVERVHE